MDGILATSMSVKSDNSPTAEARHHYWVLMIVVFAIGTSIVLLLLVACSYFSGIFKRCCSKACCRIGPIERDGEPLSPVIGISSGPDRPSPPTILFKESVINNKAKKSITFKPSQQAQTEPKKSSENQRKSTRMSSFELPKDDLHTVQTFSSEEEEEVATAQGQFPKSQQPIKCLSKVSSTNTAVSATPVRVTPDAHKTRQESQEHVDSFSTEQLVTAIAEDDIKKDLKNSIERLQIEYTALRTARKTPESAALLRETKAKLEENQKKLGQLESTEQISGTGAKGSGTKH